MSRFEADLDVRRVRTIPRQFGTVLRGFGL